MKSLSARPENIQTLFGDQKHYIIPDFQRAYSWKKDQAIKLFEDITNFFLEHRGEVNLQDSYYLGNIVYFKAENSDSVIVIDGQQRLTTISLFIKALFSINAAAIALQRCLKRVDSMTSEPINEIKIDSRVIAKDKEELNNIILYDNLDGKGDLTTNYKELVAQLESWRSTNRLTADDMNSFILMVLKNVVLLPILCESMDDALTIFDTLNNRGLPLSDADIFKAQIYKKIPSESEREKFVIEWNKLSEDNEIDVLFRYLMHVERAKHKDTTKEIGLRKFFEKSMLFENWNEVIDSLKIIYDPLMEYDEEENTEQINCVWQSLNYLPHEYCHYPAYIFWAKNAKLVDGKSILTQDKIDEFRILLWRTIKYYYTHAVATNTVNTVKDTTSKVCAALWHGEDYLQFYTDKHDKTFDLFESKFLNYDYGKIRKGLAYLLAILNSQQNFDDFSEISKLDLEHILPQNGYNNYNGWTIEQYTEKLNSLGNTVLIEKKLNIKASNEFFAKKKTHYEKSKINEVVKLCSYEDWTFNEWEKRQLEIDTQLIDFFKKID